MASSTDNTYLARPSAFKFFSRGIQEKEIHSKDIARELISVETPYNSAFVASPLQYGNDYLTFKVKK